MKIFINKANVLLLLLGAMLFVLVCLWLYGNPDINNSYSKSFIRTISVTGIVFLGFCFLGGLLKLFSNKPGVIIDENGIINNSLVLSKQVVKWDNITAIRIFEIKHTRMLLVMVDNPDDIIKQGNWFSRVLFRLNYRFYDISVHIATNLLNAKN